ncbi:MAG: lysylphosphatidylglycerol synthase transmembrane domain-containing protein [Trichloromonas sp.]|jgi:uncharacterized protein (TIRG00374 family)|nr:lysylphosphatidylglycerol synthase transmembrane domain-containing protein [Trichloromonas sp.]
MKFPSILLKSFVSLALLAMLFYQAEWDELRRLAVSVDWFLMAVGLFCVTAGVALSCFKWQIILRVDGLDCPLFTLVRYYLIGTFFNNFLPTSIGGDAVRAYYISREFGRSSVGVSSILAERLSGLFVLALFPVAAFYPSSVSIPGSVQGVLGCGLAGLALLAGILALPVVRKRWLRLLPYRVRNVMEHVAGSLGRYLRDTRCLTIVILCSILFNGLVIIATWSVSAALSLDLRMVDLMVIVPLVVLLTMIPFSLNGLGIREGGYIFFLADLGVGSTEALSFSLLNYLLVLVLGIVGGGLFAFRRIL